MRRTALLLLVACSPSAPAADAWPSSSSTTRASSVPTQSASAAVTTPTASASVPPAEPVETAAPVSSAPVSTSDASVGDVKKFLDESGATQVCEERVYPQGGRGHLTWWGYASKKAPKALLDAAAKKFPGANRHDDGLGLSFQPSGASRPTMNLDMADAASPGDLPKCKDAQPPAGTKTLVVLSTFPEIK